MGLIVSSTKRISLEQLALGLRIFVDTDRLVDNLPPLRIVYAITASSYVEKYYVLLGTESGPASWYSADPVHGAEKLYWAPCEGFVKLSLPNPVFVNELVKQFESRLEQGDKIKTECKIYS
jgi:hypothetical protein